MKKKSPFDKFIKKKSNAAIKEQFRQEKRKWKKSRKPGVSSSGLGVRSSESRFRYASDGPAGDSRPKPDFQSRFTVSAKTTADQLNVMPLNKFIAHCGVCSRRDAAELVKQGKVKVNNVLITEPGHKVSSNDEVKLNGKKISLAKNLVYILLNKPKDYITTTDDPQGRKTVMDIMRRATRERVFPVGRLDRNTSGVLLLTNDGELAQKLMHPSHEVKKVYHVTLDKPLEKKDFEQLLQGVELEDGMATVDAIGYTDARDKTQIGVEIHSGRNRIVRRMFEHLGYHVKHLDRVMFAGLTKKNVERGKWRFLTEKEIRQLKYFSPAKGKSSGKGLSS